VKSVDQRGIASGCNVKKIDALAIGAGSKLEVEK